MQKNDFITGSIPKSILVFVGPYILGILLQNLYGAVDLFVVGHYATTADVSAVTIGSQLMTTVTQLLIGFGTGATVLIGLFYGGGSEKELSQTVGSNFILFLFVGIILTAIFFFFRDAIVILMQTPKEAVTAAKQYLFYCSLGIVFIAGYNYCNSILMGLGNTKTPFIFVAVACVINIVFDIIFVRYMGLGAKGAAMATTIAQGGSLLFAFLYLRKNGLGFPFTVSDIKVHRKLTLKTIQISAPVAIQNGLISISFLFITAIINKMGLTASAAVGIVEKLITMLMIPPIALGAAVAAISAQNIGAGKPERSAKCLWTAIWMGLLPSILIVLFCQFNGVFLATLFSSNGEVINNSALYLRSYSFDCIMVSFIFCYNGYLNSMGYSWFTLLHSLLATFLFRIPLSYYLSQIENVTLYIVGWAAPISTFVSLILCTVFIFWLSLRRKKA